MTDDDLMRCGDPSCTKAHPPRAFGETAVRVLLRAQHGHRHAAAGTLTYLAEKYGTRGLVFAARIWAQIAIDRTALRDAEPEQFDGDVPLGRRIHEGLRALDLPYRVEVAMRRLAYRLARAYDGAAAADDACPEDPDGQHFATCGCDDADPLTPSGPAHELD